MKRNFSLVILVLLLSGCHNWPKDSYLEGVKSTVNTPWGPSTIEAKVIATGTAANKTAGLITTSDD
jgi:PBP1b-binding outer membrane lipoprotein LpoB